MKLEFYEHIFEKYSGAKCSENPSSESRVVPCGQTVRHDKASSRLSQLCEGPKKRNLALR
jgi:hypothetical protein